MDAVRFDTLAKSLSRTRTRRGLLGSAAALLAALGLQEARAGSRLGGAPCTSNAQCQTNKCLSSGKCSCAKSVGCKPPLNPCKQADCDLTTHHCVTTNTAAGTNCPDDGNLCTKDKCDGNGACKHPPNTAKNGATCAPGKTCQNGACLASSGCPSGTMDCNGTCQECCAHADCPGAGCLGGTCAKCQNSDQCGGPICDGHACPCTKDGACLYCGPNERNCQGECFPSQSCCPDDCSPTSGKVCGDGAFGSACYCLPGEFDCNGTCKGCCRDEDCTAPVTLCQRNSCDNGTCKKNTFNDCSPCSDNSGTCMGGGCVAGTPCQCTQTC